MLIFKINVIEVKAPITLYSSSHEMNVYSPVVG